jgi:hypothetical protein
VFEEGRRQLEEPHRRDGQAAFLGEAADEILGDEMVRGDVVPLEKIKVPVGPFDEPGPAFSGGGTPADPDDGNHGPFGRFGC